MTLRAAARSEQAERMMCTELRCETKVTEDPDVVLRVILWHSGVPFI